VSRYANLASALALANVAAGNVSIRPGFQCADSQHSFAAFNGAEGCGTISSILLTTPGSCWWFLLQRLPHPQGPAGRAQGDREGGPAMLV